MKRGLFCFIFVIFLLGFISANLTGRATQDEVNVAITISGAPPSLTLVNPENKTYLYNVSLPLNFTSNGDTFYYNLDGNSNVSIFGDVLFNTSEGQHVLNLYSNKSNLFSSEQVTFKINLSLFLIAYSEYNGSLRGDSTDFIKIPYEDLQSLQDLTLENTNFGKIFLEESINLTQDEAPSDGFLDLDSHVNISQERIEINSTALPNFEVNATLFFYNLSFSDPVIFLDGEACSSCTIFDYSGGTLNFSVDDLGGIYTVEEFVSGEVSSGAGGGIIVPDEENSFNVSEEFIFVSLISGENSSFIIEIENTWIAPRGFEINTSLENFISFSEEDFFLGKGEEKEIVLYFNAPFVETSNIYSGNILVTSRGVSKKINVLFEVNPSRDLEGVIIEVLESSLRLSPGEEFFVNLELNESFVGEELSLNYFVYDSEGDIVFEDSEFIIGERFFERSFSFSDLLDSGDYVFSMSVVSGDKSFRKSVAFKVLTGESFLEWLIILTSVITWSIICRRKCFLKK